MSARTRYASATSLAKERTPEGVSSGRPSLHIGPPSPALHAYHCSGHRMIDRSDWLGCRMPEHAQSPRRPGTGGLRTPPVDEWDSWPFVGGVTPKTLRAAEPEPDRDG